MSGGTTKTPWFVYRRGWSRGEGQVVEEARLRLYVNGAELASIMCTPHEQDLLALGFLKNEGLIDGMADIQSLHVSKDQCCVEVWLNKAVTPEGSKVITTGCGGGVSFSPSANGLQPLSSQLRLEAGKLVMLLEQLHAPDSLHARARGVHSSGLSDGEQLVAVSEDIGRHNTVDKVLGACMLRGIEPQGHILLTTGRVSSEMLRKGALMGCPIIASRNSPTSLSVAMAEEWNITLVGYVRRDSMRVYAHPQRLGYQEGVTVDVVRSGGSMVQANGAEER